MRFVALCLFRGSQCDIQCKGSMWFIRLTSKTQYGRVYVSKQGWNAQATLVKRILAKLDEEKKIKKLVVFRYKAADESTVWISIQL